MVKYLMLCFMLVIAVVFTQVKSFNIISNTNTKQESLCVVDYDTQQEMIAKLSKIKSAKILLKQNQVYEKLILKEKYLYTKIILNKNIEIIKYTEAQNTVLLL